FSGFSYSQDRSPFDEPVRTRNLYDYTQAKKQCIITGIITTQKKGTAILKLNNSEIASVYSVNDRISLEHNGIVHEFTLIEIKNKSIVLKGKNSRTYEVELR
ncbi:MAG: hypothetical protein KAQ72_14995, partial [Desulfobacula sp.]|nr:hypothetical protein [Desulfobacula sp.]